VKGYNKSELFYIFIKDWSSQAKFVDITLGFDAHGINDAE